MFYNIHGFLKVRSDIDVLPSYFASKPYKNPDVLIERSLSKPTIYPKMRSGLKYMGGDDNLFFYSDFKISKFWILVSGFKSKKLKIVYNHNKIFDRFYNISKLANWFVRLKLLKKGLTLIHSAAFSDGKNGYLISALPDTGKTTSILFLSEYGLNIISDDLCLISKSRRTYMYRDKVSVFPLLDNLRFFKNENLIKRWIFLFKFLISEIPWLNLKIHPNIEVNIEKIGNPQRTARIKKVFILTKEPEIEEKISPEDGIKMLFSSSRQFYVPPHGFCEAFWNSFCWFNKILPHYNEVESLKILSSLKKSDFYLIGSKEVSKFHKKILNYL